MIFHSFMETSGVKKTIDHLPTKINLNFYEAYHVWEMWFILSIILWVDRLIFHIVKEDKKWVMDNRHSPWCQLMWLTNHISEETLCTLWIYIVYYTTWHFMARNILSLWVLDSLTFHPDKRHRERNRRAFIHLGTMLMPFVSWPGPNYRTRIMITVSVF